MNRFALVLFALIFSMMTSVASAEVITVATQGSTIQNGGSIQAYLGAPGQGGPLLATLSNLTLSGTAVINVDLDSTGSGTVQLISTDLVVSNIPTTTITLGELGTVDLTATGLTLNLNAGPMSVSNNNYLVNGSTPGSLDAVGGTLDISNPTGTLASLFPGGIDYNFSAFPLSGPFYLDNPLVSGSIFNGPSGTVLNVGDPQFTIDSQLYTYTRYPIAYLQYTLQVQLVGAAVPEMGSFMLIGLMGGIGMAVVAYRRLLRPSTSR